MKTITHARLVPALLCATLLFHALPAVHAADANPPGKLTYQGFLTDINGTPLGNSAPIVTNIVFRIYDAAQSTGTNGLRWSEQQTVTLDKGHFSVLLGEGSAATGELVFNTNNLSAVFTGTDASDRFMEITVGASKVMPRLQFLPAPYAMLARSANQVVAPNGANLLTASVGAIGINKANPATALDVGGTITGTGLNIVGAITGTSTLSVSGAATAASFSGNGANLTSLDAAKVTTGTLTEARIPRNLPGTLTVGTLTATNFQSSALALINVIYPVGIFYVQYPNVDSNDEGTAFPANQRPESLFPGTTWTERFTDGVFFRTKGGHAAESRVNGVQDYGLKRLTGYTPWFQVDYNNPGHGREGVFTSFQNGYGGTDGGGGSDTVTRALFDSAAQSNPSDNEVRPKNRLKKVWQRTN